MKNHERLQFLRGCGVAAFAVTAIFLVASQTCRAQGVGAPPSGAATASNATQFPAIGALMEEVLANQDKLDKIHENYASNDMRIEEKLDKRGNVKKTTTYVYQVSFLGPNEIDRLIEKNGKALSTDEQKKEDERVREAEGARSGEDYDSGLPARGQVLKSAPRAADRRRADRIRFRGQSRLSCKNANTKSGTGADGHDLD